MPSALNFKDKNPLLELSDGNLRVEYKGPGKSDTDAATVRANNPISAACGLYYFECLILSKGRDGYIGIGLCMSTVALNRLPGWEKNSYGYHGDDGFSFHGSGAGSSYGPTFTTGDIIGCGINFVTGTVFFTKNGINLGIAFSDVRGTFFPCVGLRTPGEKVEVNFGTKPFRYDYEAALRDEKEKVLSSILERPVPGQERVLADLVLSYLLHHGYSDTAERFAKSSGCDTENTLLQLDQVAQRKRITNCVLDGDMNAAVALTSELHPNLFALNPDILFQLRCQKFVELFSTASLDEAMQYGRAELASYFTTGSETHKTVLQEIFSLMAYTEPRSSPVAYLLDPKRREPVAAALNSALLVHENKPASHALETLVQHTAACMDLLVQNSVPASGLLHLSDFLER